MEDAFACRGIVHGNGERLRRASNDIAKVASFALMPNSRLKNASQ